MNKKNKKRDMTKLKLIAILALTVFATSAVTYGFFNFTKQQSGKNDVMSGCFDVEMTNESASINLSNAYPISDAKGQEMTPYTFTITNTCSIDAAYFLVIDTKTGSFDSSHINASLDGSAAKALSTYNINSGYPAENGYSYSYILTSGSLAIGASKTFDIRLWINSETTYEDVQNQSWEGQVRVINVVKEVGDATGLAAQTLKNLGLEANLFQTVNFDEPATTDEGIFEMDDDYGASYYFRGAVENNYVQFAGFYWRIIRVNGDGSLRIVYDGTQAYANGANTSDRFIGTSAYNTNYNDAKYVGYMYGPVGTTASTSKAQAQTNTADSTIKTYIDAWYKTNIVDAGYESAVADVLFCNDRSTPGQATTLWTNDTGLGYGTNRTGYGGFGRFRTGNNSTSLSARTGIQPTFKCAQKNDAFTVSDTVKGNGALTYPVGLITVDEIVSAGSGKYGTANYSYYLYHPGNWWLSLSPMYFDGSSARAFGVYSNGSLNCTYATSGVGAVAPVISLSTEYVNTMIGNGTMNDPFRTA